jgi:hypothetical protein
MNDRVSRLLGEINTIAAALPGVFSAAQWGGRAYKLPGPGGRRNRPKLLAFVSPARDGRAVGVSFKLPPQRAADVIERHAWIEPHSFRTMAPSGWVSAAVSNKRQLKPLARLLEESRSLYPPPEPPESEQAATTRGVGGGQTETTVTRAATDLVARRIDRVMKEAKAEGWSPPAPDDFDF